MLEARGVVLDSYHINYSLFVYRVWPLFSKQVVKCNVEG